MKPLLIIKTGRTLSQVPPARGDFERWIAECMSLEAGDCHTCEVSAGAAVDYHPQGREMGTTRVRQRPGALLDG